MKTSIINDVLSRETKESYVVLIPKMKFFIEPEISCSRFFSEACFGSESHRTELGDFLFERMKNSIFIDVPCGLLSAREDGKDVNLLPLVQKLGASAYMEVDLTAEVLRDRLPQATDIVAGGTYALAKSIGEVSVRQESGLDVFTMQDDVLGFLSKISDTADRPPITVYLSALQPDATLCAEEEAQENVVVPYLRALYDELARICSDADTLIVNSAAMLSAGIDEERFPEANATVALFQRGFGLLRRCKYDKVHAYMKTSLDEKD